MREVRSAPDLERALDLRRRDHRGGLRRLDQEIKERIRKEFAEAERAEDPSADELELQVTAELPQLDDEVLPAGKYRIGDTINKTLRLGLEKNGDRIIFGEDVEDPKGGVFRLTQKLSTEFPKQVYNSPLAESTIMGVACGLASYGKRPVFELQFIDFIGPGWNQLVTNLSTLRWRSFGTWTCPVVIYAPYGAYLPGGSLWHSQANEAALAHFPGINVAIPSTPEDAAGLLWTAMHCEDPTFVLIPKHLLWAEHESAEPVRAVPLGVARKRHSGSDVTLVAWGNTVEKSLEALKEIGAEVSVDLIDLRSIVPWDRAAIEESVRRTGPAGGGARGQRELQRRTNDCLPPCGVAGCLERADRSADSREQDECDDRLQPDLRIRRAARCETNRRRRPACDELHGDGTPPCRGCVTHARQTGPRASRLQKGRRQRSKRPPELNANKRSRSRSWVKEFATPKSSRS